jgi:hypothetical protein
MGPTVIKKIIIACAMLTAGCSHATFPASEPPKALLSGFWQPNCAAICFVRVTVTDAESGQAVTEVKVTEQGTSTGVLIDALKPKVLAR